MMPKSKSVMGAAMSGDGNGVGPEPTASSCFKMAINPLLAELPGRIKLSTNAKTSSVSSQ